MSAARIGTGAKAMYGLRVWVMLISFVALACAEDDVPVGPELDAAMECTVSSEPVPEGLSCIAAVCRGAAPPSCNLRCGPGGCVMCSGGKWRPTVVDCPTRGWDAGPDADAGHAGDRDGSTSLDAAR